MTRLVNGQNKKSNTTTKKKNLKLVDYQNLPTKHHDGFA